MKKIETMQRSLCIFTRGALPKNMTFGEFISHLEDHVKFEFLSEIASKIDFRKRYLFSIVPVETKEKDDWGFIRELFEFTMYEIEDDEAIKKETQTLHGLPNGL